MVRALLVEDDRRFVAALTKALGRCGFEVEHAPGAVAALAAPPCDIVLLDLGLPDGDGLEVCRRLRDRSEVGIIVLTSRGTERDRVIGLRAGADDYLVKPFGMAELQARMEAVLRRARPRHDGVRVVGRLTVDLAAHTLTVGGEAVRVTPKEFTLLARLTREPGAAVERETLLREVWGTSWQSRSRTLDVHISTLRGKLGDEVRIETLHGVGYRIVACGE
ncbi:response regulator transcription factor [Actinoallomurus sp. CA-150999]|uniref:response regulator transcription factor n=1 Tax=Actinoallomurus sp. CA-150999 TaxID=3239887 RepID=UPI003D8CAD6A